ncbi:amidohydrolase family protein [Pseudonocardia eucalypti]|uniref:Amidohydrolase family protein n=1 Tax=Pseudonocardia eucalypti TaxID=648755 RepID=A0ABP9QAI2_9PSEU|nr:cytosine deaminase [Pseudonocardia eucalypti]
MAAEPRVGQAVSALRGVRTVDGASVDVSIGPDGRVGSVVPATGDPAGKGELELPGWVVLPSAVEPHAHLEKALTWSAMGAPYGDLFTAIESWSRYAVDMTEADVADRARRALGRYLAAGFTAVRSHVNVVVAAADPLCGVRALVGLREELRDVLDLQVCLLADHQMPVELIERALDLGVDLLGGSAHRAPDPAAEVNRLVDIAQRRDLEMDLHTDEQTNPEALTILELARQWRSRGLRRRVAASHCVSLGCLARPALDAVLAEVSAVGMSVVTLPITNLYLQGRSSDRPKPRGLTAVRELLAAGITVAAGGDNLRDPFNPVGRPDPFETTSLLITAAHLDAGEALTAVTDAGRAVLGLPAAGPVAGRLADLLVVQAEDLSDVVAGPVGSRLVLRRGRVVAYTSVRRETALGVG